MSTPSLPDVQSQSAPKRRRISHAAAAAAARREQRADASAVTDARRVRNALALTAINERRQRDQRLPLRETLRFDSQLVSGRGCVDACVMAVGEAPGQEEAECGRPFVGRSGAFLCETLRERGLSAEQNLYITNLVCVQPPRNRDPTYTECLGHVPYLAATIDSVRPRVILAVGRIAATWLLGGLDAQRVHRDETAHGRFRGLSRSDLTRCVAIGQENGKARAVRFGAEGDAGAWWAWVVPIYHPSYLQRLADEPRRAWLHGSKLTEWHAAIDSHANWLRIEPRDTTVVVAREVWQRESTDVLSELHGDASDGDASRVVFVEDAGTHLSYVREETLAPLRDETVRCVETEAEETGRITFQCLTMEWDRVRNSFLAYGRAANGDSIVCRVNDFQFVCYVTLSEREWQRATALARSTRPGDVDAAVRGAVAHYTALLHASIDSRGSDSGMDGSGARPRAGFALGVVFGRMDAYGYEPQFADTRRHLRLSTDRHADLVPLARLLACHLPRAKWFETSFTPVQQLTFYRAVVASGWMCIDARHMATNVVRNRPIGYTGPLQQLDTSGYSHCDLEIEAAALASTSFAPDDPAWLGYAPQVVLAWDSETLGKTPETGAIACISGVVHVATDDGQRVTVDRAVGRSSHMHVYNFVIGACEPAARADCQAHDSTTYCFRSEAEMLVGWLRFVVELDPDVLSGHNVKAFDEAFLARRCALVLTPEQYISTGRIRDDRPTEISRRLFFTRAHGARWLTSVRLRGRTIIDTLEWGLRTQKLSSYRLATMAGVFLNGTTKNDVPYVAIPGLFTGSPASRSELVRYCAQDSMIVLRLLLNQMVLSTTHQRARVCRGVYADAIYTAGVQQQVLCAMWMENFARGHRYLLPTHTWEADNAAALSADVEADAATLSRAPLHLEDHDAGVEAAAELINRAMGVDEDDPDANYTAAPQTTAAADAANAAPVAPAPPAKRRRVQKPLASFFTVEKVPSRKPEPPPAPVAAAPVAAPKKQSYQGAIVMEPVVGFYEAGERKRERVPLVDMNKRPDETGDECATRVARLRAAVRARERTRWRTVRAPAPDDDIVIGSDGTLQQVPAGRPVLMLDVTSMYPSIQSEKGVSHERKIVCPEVDLWRVHRLRRDEVNRSPVPSYELGREGLPVWFVRRDAWGRRMLGERCVPVPDGAAWVVRSTFEELTGRFGLDHGHIAAYEDEQLCAKFAPSTAGAAYVDGDLSPPRVAEWRLSCDWAHERVRERMSATERAERLCRVECVYVPGVRIRRSEIDSSALDWYETSFESLLRPASGTPHQADDTEHWLTADQIGDGLVPRTVSTLNAKRSWAKRQRNSFPKSDSRYWTYEAMQAALKVVANSVYGSTGLDKESGKLGDIDLGAAVTAWGREIIMMARNAVCDELRGNVNVGGDTDSFAFVSDWVHTAEQGLEAGIWFSYWVNRRCPVRVRFAFEKAMSPWLCTGKKRYTGLYYTDDTNGSLFAKKRWVELNLAPARWDALFRADDWHVPLADDSTARRGAEHGEALDDARGRLFTKKRWAALLRTAEAELEAFTTIDELRAHIYLPRYDGAEFDPVEHAVLTSKGNETVRRDASPYVKEILNTVFDLVFRQCSVRRAVLHVRQRITDLLEGRVGVMELAASSQVSKLHYKSRALPHLRVMEQQERRGERVYVIGDRVPYVYVLAPVAKAHAKSARGLGLVAAESGTRAYECVEHPDSVMRNSDTIHVDHDYYLNKKLVKALLRTFGGLLDDPRHILLGDAPPAHTARRKRAHVDRASFTRRHVKARVSSEASALSAFVDVYTACVACPRQPHNANGPLRDAPRLATRAAHCHAHRVDEHAAPCGSKACGKRVLCDVCARSADARTAADTRLAGDIEELHAKHERAMDVCRACTRSETILCDYFNCKSYRPRIESGALLDRARTTRAAVQLYASEDVQAQTVVGYGA